jgi:hypothetical protein
MNTASGGYLFTGLTSQNVFQNLSLFWSELFTEGLKFRFIHGFRFFQGQIGF